MPHFWVRSTVEHAFGCSAHVFAVLMLLYALRSVPNVWRIQQFGTTSMFCVTLVLSRSIRRRFVSFVHTPTMWYQSVAHVKHTYPPEHRTTSSFVFFLILFISERIFFILFFDIQTVSSESETNHVRIENTQCHRPNKRNVRVLVSYVVCVINHNCKYEVNRAARGCSRAKHYDNHK